MIKSISMATRKELAAEMEVAFAAYRKDSVGRQLIQRATVYLRQDSAAPQLKAALEMTKRELAFMVGKHHPKGVESTASYALEKADAALKAASEGESG